MPAEHSSSDRTRIALVACCLLAVALAGAIVPALGTDTDADADVDTAAAESPLDRLLPGESVPYVSGSDRNEPTGDGATGFGALEPGNATGVGGETGFDNGTYASRDTTIHFRVESDEPAFWRTGAYGTYTGRGWTRTNETTAYDPPIGAAAASGAPLEYDVTLRQPSRAVPTAWRPRTVNGPEELVTTDQLAVRSPARLDAGTTYTATSRTTERDPASLRDADTDYPADVRERYTQLPAGTPDRLGEFAGDLTADAETTYGMATAVQGWLREEKAYSLEVSRESDRIADTFVFEMTAGYCEYFATAMTTMLRSQGVPARYVVGYSSGQRVGEDTYEVRALNAHAWVEVYVPGSGWVTFDPTPGDARLEAQREILESAPTESTYGLREPGSPGEVFEPGAVRNASTDRAPDEETPEIPGPGLAYGVRVNRSVVPGATVELTITQFGGPVPDRPVRFNRESIGRTGEDGTLTATVPYESELGVGVLDRVSAPPERTFSLETDASVDVEGVPIGGRPVTVRATVADVPVRDAAVSVDGERVATTDEAGVATVALPERTGDATVSVERGAVEGTETVGLRELSVEAGPVLPLALPGSRVSVSASAGDRPTANATVFVDGDAVAETGSDGTATVRLPFAAETTVRAVHPAAGSADGSGVADGLADETTLSGLIGNLLAVLATGVSLAAIAVAAVFPDSTPGRLAVAAGLFPARLLAASGRTLIGLVAAIDERARRPSPRDLRTLFDAVGPSDRSARRSEPGDGPTPRPNLGAVSGDDRADPRHRPAIRAAWGRLLRSVSLRDVGSKSPGEIAAHAIRTDGLPAEPVRLLRDAFREAEYASGPPTERPDRIDAAIRAIETAADDARGDEALPDDAATDVADTATDDAPSDGDSSGDAD
ncbi:transglutaminase TgpA family protein [Natronomonas sp.]|uniref:transglutaminase TgpA family protein n=1 Tax=Natronomonas sp. TaxID=2184060 RepID=UPI00260553FD|nr:transglutaminaseTgpA domain-containing protein [Natronomonas sp.]